MPFVPTGAEDILKLSLLINIVQIHIIKSVIFFSNHFYEQNVFCDIPLDREYAILSRVVALYII